MRAELVAEAAFAPRSSAWHLPGPGWLIQTQDAETILVVDDLLVERARFRVPSKWRGKHCVTPDLRFVAVSDRDRVLLVDPTGKTVWQSRHPSWGRGDSESGSCWVSRDGRRVWATVPTEEAPDAWRLLDVASGEVLAEAALQCCAAGSHPVAHPDGEHIGLSVGEGQDGAEVYWGRWEADRLVVRRVDDRTRVLVDARPDGRHYLTTPHSEDRACTLCIHDFQTGAVLARRAAADTFAGEDWFDYQAGYLGQDLILAGSTEAERHVLLGADDLNLIGPVDYPPDACKQAIVTGAGATWLTNDYQAGRFQLWRLVDQLAQPGG